MTIPLSKSSDGVKVLDSQAATVICGARAFIVLTFPSERVTFVFEWKPSKGARPGAYVSRRVTPPLPPDLAVTGLLCAHPEADPLTVADQEIERYRRSLLLARRDADRLQKQILGLLRRKKPSRKSRRPGKRTGKKD